MGIYLAQLLNGIPRRAAYSANEISWWGRGGRAVDPSCIRRSRGSAEKGGSRRLEE